jgi:hypothetical protein
LFLRPLTGAEDTGQNSKFILFHKFLQESSRTKQASLLSMLIYSHITNSAFSYFGHNFFLLEMASEAPNLLVGTILCVIIGIPQKITT